MKKLLILPCLLIIVLLNSCGDKNNPQPVVATKLCKPITLNSSGTYTSKGYYTYDNNNILKIVKIVAAGRTTIQTYEFNGLNQNIKSSDCDTLGNILNYSIYEYNSEGKLSKKTNYSKQNNSYVPGCSFTFQYDTNGDLIREDMICSSTSSYKTYTYGNLTKLVKYYSSSGTLEGSDEIEFDNKQIPPYIGNNPPNFDRYSKNPILKLTSYTAPGAPSRLPSYTNNWQFNAEGYPLQMIKTFQGASNSEIWTYTYDCQ